MGPNSELKSIIRVTDCSWTLHECYNWYFSSTRMHYNDQK